jgi:hypothetical protein
MLTLGRIRTGLTASFKWGGRLHIRPLFSPQGAMEMMLLQQLLIVIYFGFSFCWQFPKKACRSEGKKHLGPAHYYVACVYTTTSYYYCASSSTSNGLHALCFCAAGNDVQFTWL